MIKIIKKFSKNIISSKDGIYIVLNTIDPQYYQRIYHNVHTKEKPYGHWVEILEGEVK